MTDFKKTNKKKLSNLVKEQLPSFVLEDHPQFAEFVSAYYLFLESAELQISSFTAVDNILLEGEGTTDNFVLLERTDSFGLDANDKLVQEELTFSGTFQKKEVITGATSGATATILAEDFANSKYIISANNGFITGETVTGATSGATGIVGRYRANPIENIQQFLNYSDPDHTISDFLTQMKEEFLKTIPTNTDSSVNRRKLIKNIKTLYRSKGTDKAHQVFFRLLFNESSEIYKPTVDMLRISDGKFSTNNFLRCTQTAAQAIDNPIFLIGQEIKQTNDPADENVNEATAIVENITRFQEGSVVVTEVEINAETTTGTFVNGQTVSGISNIDSDNLINLTISQAVSSTTITNDGGTLTVGDEATISGGAGTGARIQVDDISGGGVDEVIVNVAGTGYEIGDTITFSSGTAEAKVAVVGGGFAPETGSVPIHVELESGTITGGGSGDLLLEDFSDGTIGKFLDSASQEVENEIRFELENEVGHLLAEDDDNQVSDTFFILNQESKLNVPYDIEEDEHIILEDSISKVGTIGDKIVQENGTGVGDITDIRMIASGGGYTTLPTATITVGDRFIGLESQTNLQRLAVIELESSPGSDGQPDHLEFQRNTGNILDEQETTVAVEGDGTGAGRIELESGGNILNETFDGANATVIPYGAEIGRATSLGIIEHGINFTSAPTLVFPHYAVVKSASGTITEDETFTSNVSGATGTVVDFTAPLLKYTVTSGVLEVGDTVTFSGGETAVVVKSDPLTGTSSIATNIFTKGKYISQDGQLSELTKKIQDSLYYQDFSYVVKVSEAIDKWRDSIKKAVHPSGFFVTGEVNIATRLDAQVKQPVGASLSSGLFSGTVDSPIYMRLNTLFSTLFDRRTGVGLRSMSNGVELDGKTKLSSAVARTGIAIEPQNDYRDPTTNTQKAVNLSPETTMELEQRNRNSFYSLNSEPFTLEDGTGFLAKEDAGFVVDEFGYTVRGVSVSNGFAYAGPRQRNLRAPFERYAHNNGILLEGHTETGNSNIRLENESGVITSEFGISASTTIADWAQLRFSGTLNENVDGETMRLKDLEGTNSDLDHRNNFAFPTDITQEPS
tara:strand:- start:419 stop:3661 length:3243 start_codon:yes stop_codon:yes gene_type:complete